jgi:hypothetical protein
MYKVDGTDLTNIANAIRAKTGEAGTMTITDMPTEIRSISGGGGDLPRKIRRCTWSEYQSSTKDNDTLYSIYGNGKLGDVTSKLMVGTKQIYPYCREGYEIDFVNVYFPDTQTSTIIYCIETGVCVDGDNKTRNFELSFNATKSTTASSFYGDQEVIGTGNASTLKELYFFGNDLKVNANGYGDEKILDNAWDQDITLKRISSGTQLEIYKNGILSKTINITPIDNTYTLGIGRYSERYGFQGTLNYITFKWLS